MGTEKSDAIEIAADKYRSFLHDETHNDIQWRHGGPPNYDAVNKLFEEGRTKASLSLSLSFSLHIYIYVSIFCV